MVLLLFPDVVDLSGVGMVNALTFMLLLEMSMRHAEAMAVSLNMISAFGCSFLIANVYVDYLKLFRSSEALLNLMTTPS